jgi:hypothetical protein
MCLHITMYVVMCFACTTGQMYNWATLFLGGNKYKNLALQVGGV